MALSDCVKCYETPCVCGYEYKDWPIEKLEKQIALLQKVLFEAKQKDRVDSSS
jgi:hypothetical protein